MAVYRVFVTWESEDKRRLAVVSDTPSKVMMVTTDRKEAIDEAYRLSHEGKNHGLRAVVDEDVKHGHSRIWDSHPVKIRPVLAKPKAQV